ncbi:MAG: hypothetical protein ACTSPU_14985 [Promethearchaeota archaeon]
MSSNTSKSRLQDYSFLFESNLSDFVISFKELFNHIKTIDIYSGKENIPFREKDEEFQRLLLSEFKT